MTFQIYVGGQRVNSDFITSTPAWASQQPNKSRKRCSDDTDEAAMSAANSKRQQSSPLGSVTNLLVHGTEQ